MTLTVGPGPWGDAPSGSYNRDVGSNAGLLYLEPQPRRIRGIAGGVTVVDSLRSRMLHENGRLPIYLYPEDEVRMDLLSGGEGEAGTPQKGPLQLWNLAVGGDAIRGAAFSYPDPPENASWLRGLVGFNWNALDEWYEEDELAIVHPRDPYHRVDALETSRHVRILIEGEVVADTKRAKVVFETALPPRWYIPPEDVKAELLEPSNHSTGCAYKGFASYHSVRAGDHVEKDVAWFYEEAPARGRPDQGPHRVFRRAR